MEEKNSKIALKMTDLSNILVLQGNSLKLATNKIYFLLLIRKPNNLINRSFFKRFSIFFLLNRCKFNFENICVSFVGFAALYVDENLRNIYFSIFCENHSTCNCSKTHNFGPNFMNEGFLEFKLQGEYFVIGANDD